MLENEEKIKALLDRADQETNHEGTMQPSKQGFSILTWRHGPKWKPQAKRERAEMISIEPNRVGTERTSRNRPSEITKALIK